MRVFLLAIAASLLPVAATGIELLVQRADTTCFCQAPAVLGANSLPRKSPRRSMSPNRLYAMAKPSTVKKGSSSRFMTQLPPGSARPSLVVFDLDNTLWTPELYQLRTTPKAGKDIWLFDGAQDALFEIATQPLWAQSEFALASRTNKGPWAFSLLERFEVDDAGTTMDKLFRFKQIYTGSKRKHFEKLREETGVAFEDMIFFDDSTMNTVEIERMGVLCAHCPRGLTSGIWDNALKEFAKMKADRVPFMGKTISAPAPAPSRTITVMVPHEKVGLLIGKAGMKIKMLQEETGATVTIDRKPTTETETKVIVKGTPQQVEDAKVRIHKTCFAGEIAS